MNFIKSVVWQGEKLEHWQDEEAEVSEQIGIVSHFLGGHKQLANPKKPVKFLTMAA